MAVKWPWARQPRSGKDRVESEPTRSETGGPAPTPSESDRALLGFLTSRLQESRAALQQALPEIVIGLAYEAGKQWLTWKQDQRGGGQLVDERNKNNLKWYRTVNLIRPRVLVNVARFTAARPDVSLTPKSTRDLDIRAADEARVVIDHYETVNDGRDQLRRLAWYHFCGTTAGVLFWWDTSAWATVPKPGPNGVDGYTLAQIGEERERVVFGHQLLLDPRFPRPEDARYIAIEEWLSLAEIRERWGASVEPDQSNRSELSQAAGEVASFLGGWWAQKVAPRAKKVYSYYERPSLTFPMGRTVIFTDDQILFQQEELPCADREAGTPGVIPLVLTGYQPRLDSPYHRNPVSDAAQPQLDYNTLRSQVIHQLKRSGKHRQVRRMDDMAGADVEDLTEEGPDSITLWYAAGSVPPQDSPIPPPPEMLLSVMADCREEINDILGVHSVSSGQGDPNADSGYAIRLLTDNDRTQQAPYNQAMQRLVEDRARMRIRFASHYVLEPRAWGLDDLENPQDADGRVSALPALRSGGAVAVKIVEASGTPATPEVMDEETMALFDKGALGDPALPETQQMLLELLHSPAASRARELVERRAQEMALQNAMTPPPDPAAMVPPGAPPPDPALSPNQDPLQPPMALGEPGSPAPLNLPPPDLAGGLF